MRISCIYFPIMENDSQLDRIFSALADRRRRAMLTELSEASKSVGELAKSFDLTMGAVSKHIAILERAGLITKSRRGRVVHCHMNLDTWLEVVKFMAMQTRFWERRLAELEDYIAEPGMRSRP